MRALTSSAGAESHDRSAPSSERQEERVIVMLLRVDCRDDAAADEFDRLTARVFQQVADNEPGTLVFANHMVAGQPLTRVFYEIYRDEEAATIHSRGEALQQLLASQDALVAGFHIDQLTLELAKGLPPGAT
jgi:quinol monooxygenase YgiN